jgi:hypothetical protein
VSFGRQRSRGWLTALAAVLVLSTAPAAFGSRAPTSEQSTAIGHAVDSFFSGWYYGSSSTVHVHTVRIRIASADGNWASAVVSGPARSGRSAPSGPLLLWHAPGSPNSPAGGPARQWIVVSPRYSAEFAWCGIAPRSVTVDLGADYGC